jgi:LemA protein
MTLPLMICIAIVFFFLVIYNRLVRSKNLIREAWSGIDVQLKRRSTLIPNLVETVRGYSQHEKELFENIAELRERSAQTVLLKDKAGAEGQLSGGLKSLFAVAEAYPELKASGNFLALQKELVEVEDQIQYARRYYNGVIRDYNIWVESFPSNLVALLFGFKREEFFEISLATERETPEVKL